MHLPLVTTAFGREIENAMPVATRGPLPSAAGSRALRGLPGGLGASEPGAAQAPRCRALSETCDNTRCEKRTRRPRALVRSTSATACGIVGARFSSLFAYRWPGCSGPPALGRGPRGRVSPDKRSDGCKQRSKPAWVGTRVGSCHRSPLPEEGRGARTGWQCEGTDGRWAARAFLPHCANQRCRRWPKGEWAGRPPLVFDAGGLGGLERELRPPQRHRLSRRLQIR